MRSKYFPFHLPAMLAIASLFFGCDSAEVSQRRPTDLRGDGATASTPMLDPDFGVSGTFSILAMDPETGVCGVAVAS